MIPAFVEDTTSVALLAVTIPAWRAQLTSSLQPLDPENDAVRHVAPRVGVTRLGLVARATTTWKFKDRLLGFVVDLLVGA